MELWFSISACSFIYYMLTRWTCPIDYLDIAGGVIMLLAGPASVLLVKCDIGELILQKLLGV